MEAIGNGRCRKRDLVGLLLRKNGTHDEAVSALENLMLDWPSDVVLIDGASPEEIDKNMFKFTVNLGAKVERLRDFVGPENASSRHTEEEKWRQSRQGNGSAVVGGQRSMGLVAGTRRDDRG